jgi:hypothetical protein
MRHDRGVSSPTESGRFRRHPARLLIALGLIVTVIGSALPWIAWTEFTGVSFSLSGFDRMANGWFLILGAAALTWLVMNSTAVEARLAVVRAAPFGIAVYLAGAVNWSYSDVIYVFDEKTSEGAAVSIQPGMWVAFAGAGLCIVGALWLTALDIRRRGAWIHRDDVVRAWRPTVVAPALGLVVGAVAGFFLTVWLAAKLFPSPSASYLYLFLALFGVFLGAVTGRRVGEFIGQALAGPQTAAPPLTGARSRRP